MKINFFKKTLLLLVSLSALFVLSGCQEKPPAEDQIIADMPGELTEIFVDDVPIGMSIDNIEITRRQTNEKDDTVYFKYQMSGGPYCVTGSYRFDYVYYDQGGWILEDYAINSEPEIKLVDNDSLTELADSIEDVFYEKLSKPDEWNRLFGYGYDTANLLDYQSNDQNICFTYEVSRSEPYRVLSGSLTYSLTIKHSGGLNFYWYDIYDDSNVGEAWDLVGTWKAYHNEKKYITVTIDSYDSTDNTLHISTGHSVSPGGFSGPQKNVWNDLTISLSSMEKYDLYFSYKGKGYGENLLSLGFTPDSAVFHTQGRSWAVERTEP